MHVSGCDDNVSGCQDDTRNRYIGRDVNEKMNRYIVNKVDIYVINVSATITIENQTLNL